MPKELGNAVYAAVHKLESAARPKDVEDATEPVQDLLGEYLPQFPARHRRK